MPKTDASRTAPPARGIQVVRIDAPDIDWHDYEDEMPGDETPDGVGPGQYAVVFESEDKRIVVGVWRRDADVGELVGEGQAIDFVVEGTVELTGDDGVPQQAGPGDVLLYTETDAGRWNQAGPIKKVFVHIRD
jgi:uncharacterized cupin superfamily protein